MLKILALDTSTDFCSVALAIDSGIIVRETRAGQSHSSVLLRMVDELLREGDVRLRDVDAIAFGKGPGSFTGLRIACGVVQGLSLGADVPVVGIGTLLAMAVGSGADQVICCVDARVHEIYHATYRCCMASAASTHGDYGVSSVTSVPARGWQWQVVHEPSLCAPAAAPSVEGSGWLGCGSGFAAYGEALEARYAAQLVAIEPGRYPHARDIAALALPMVERGEVFSAEAAAPVYLRDKVALRSDERATR